MHHAPSSPSQARQGQNSSSMITSDKMNITGGKFYQTFNDNRQYRLQDDIRSSKPALDVLKEAAAPAAFHNSGARFDAPKCHPRTRVAVLQKIMDWILLQDDETRSSLIMWLSGAAGAGKSSIAQSIIEQLLTQTDNLMLASFFFSKSDPTRNHAQALIATLAYQVYRSIPPIQARMASAIDDDPLIFTRVLDYQLVTLILQPLQDLLTSENFENPRSRYMIVIDGLDECTDRASQRLILTSICNEMRRFQLPIAFLIASRPEHDINEVFSSRSMQGIHARLMLDHTYSPDADIRTFLVDNFERIREEHPFRRMIPNNWPGYKVISEIATKSSGQFIYAATVVKFTESPRHRPNQRLDIVRSLRPVKGDLPFQELDALYCHILSSLDAESIEKVLQTLAFVFLSSEHRSIPSVSEIEKFMTYDEGELRLIFCDVGALVDIKGEDYGNCQLNILHASLRDFLLDRARSKAFYVDIEMARTELVSSCLRHLLCMSNGSPKIEEIVHLFVSHAPSCDISTDLCEQATTFPVTEICFSHSFVDSLTGSSVAYKFLPIFFNLIKRIANDNLAWSDNDHHSHALDLVFLSKMEHYYSRGSLSLLTVLIFHAGSHHLVPLLRMSSSLLPCPREALEEEIFDLSIHHELYLFETFLCQRNAYTENFQAFMLDQTRSEQYTLGEEIYARAALYCMQRLEDKNWLRQLEQAAYLWTNNATTDSDAGEPVDEPNDRGAQYNRERDDNCDLCNSLFFKDELWTWKSGNIVTLNGRDFDPEIYPLVLGYLIYLLPLSGRYNPLIQQCRQHNLSLGSPAAYFPIRTRRASRVIREYLNRNKWSELSEVPCKGQKVEKDDVAWQCLAM